MAIGTITSTGKQNAAVAGGLKYKKIQKGVVSFCFLGDDTVVDFASLVNFILNNGGSTSTELSTGYKYRRKTSIPCAGASITDSYQYIFAVLTVLQERQYDSIPWQLVDVKAIGVRDAATSGYTTYVIDSSWTVV